MALQSDVDGLPQRRADGTPTLSEGWWGQRCRTSLAERTGQQMEERVNFVALRMLTGAPAAGIKRKF